MAGGCWLSRRWFASVLSTVRYRTCCLQGIGFQATGTGVSILYGGSIIAYVQLRTVCTGTTTVSVPYPGMQSGMIAAVLHVQSTY